MSADIVKWSGAASFLAPPLSSGLLVLFGGVFLGYLQTLGCHPIASLDHFQPDMLGSAEMVEEVQTGDSKIVKVLLDRTVFLIVFSF